MTFRLGFVATTKGLVQITASCEDVTQIDALSNVLWSEGERLSATSISVDMDPQACLFSRALRANKTDFIKAVLPFCGARFLRLLVEDDVMLLEIEAIEPKTALALDEWLSQFL